MPGSASSRVAYHRLGISLETATPAPEAVAAATESVLEDTEMRASVHELTRVYAARDPLSEIERLILA